MIKIILPVFVVFLLAFLTFMPSFASANGGDQRIVEGKYYINLSRAPFTPRVGVETSFLASFVDVQKDKLISEELIARIRIARLGGGGKREFLFEKDNMKVEGGVMDFQYAFAESGLHEIFFDFAFASEPEAVYKTPDFLLDIQEPLMPAKSNKPLIVGLIAGITGAFFSGLFIGRKTKKES